MIFLIPIIILHLFVLSRLIFAPYPELFVYPYLTNNGLLPYRDILDQHFPGLMFLPINLDNLGMITPLIARIWQFGIVAAIQVLIFLIGRKIFKSEKKALLANLIFLVWQPFFEGWVLWIDSLLPILLLPAFYFSLAAYERGKGRDLILAGLFLGTALIFKQVVGPLIAGVILILFFKRKNLKEILYFLVGLLPIPVITGIYLVSLGVIKDFWYWTVVFNLTTFAKYGKRGPMLFELVEVGAVIGFSFLAALTKKFKGTAFLLTLFLIGALFSANARFDFVHFQPALPFAFLLTVEGITYFWKKGKLAIFAYLVAIVLLLPPFYKSHLGSKVLFFDKGDYSVTGKIESLTRPGEKIFLYGLPANYYQITKTLPAGNVFVFQFPWFMMISEDRVLAGLMSDMPQLVVADRSVTIDGQKLTDFSPKINSFLMQEYEIYDKIGSIEFLRLKKQYARSN